MVEGRGGTETMIEPIRFVCVSDDRNATAQLFRQGRSVSALVRVGTRIYSQTKFRRLYDDNEDLARRWAAGHIRRYNARERNR